MTITRQVMRTFACAAAMALSAAVATGQTTAPLPGHDHGSRPHAMPQVDVEARMALLDERIAILAGDMKMLTGELRIQTMADLIEAMVERQALTDRRVRQMHESMRQRMMNQSPPPPAAAR